MSTGTTPRKVRMPDTVWAQFGALCFDRSGIIRQFVRWYIGEPGAKLPRRPPRKDDHAEETKT